MTLSLLNSDGATAFTGLTKVRLSYTPPNSTQRLADLDYNGSPITIDNVNGEKLIPLGNTMPYTIQVWSGNFYGSAQTYLPSTGIYPTSRTASLSISNAQLATVKVTVKGTNKVNGVNVLCKNASVTVSGGPFGSAPWSFTAPGTTASGGGAAVFNNVPISSGTNYSITARRSDGQRDRLDEQAGRCRHKHLHSHAVFGKHHVLSMRLRRPCFRSESGFTLIELVVAMAILVTVVSSIATVLTSLVTSSTKTMNESTLQTEARAAVDTLVADARTAYTGDAALKPVAAASGTQFTFYAPDRQQQFHLREIAYQVSGGNLQRAAAMSTDNNGAPWTGLPFTGTWSWTTVVGSVAANPGNTPVFTYATDSKGNVVQVNVTLTVDPPGQAAARTFTGSATLRAIQS